MAGNEEEKSQLAKTICELSACANLHHPHINKSQFINWYLVLNVDENADICRVRKQYHKLALQLHPDKNSNSMAEAAFKLVSEAYLCLSDTTRRREFDTERKTMSCIKCNPNSSKRTDPPPLTNSNNNATTPKPTQASRNSRIRGRVRELRAKLAEESTIINRCLMANAAASAAKALGAQKESPVFDPSDYPHHRTARLEEQPSEWETETCTMEQFMTTQYSSV
ncbi:meiotically up-regulated gene 184 protein-like [Salvia splendens]|uniref:meiotically up-regulated gene 184 protein-like n=1 Tax=Salvia splendens TaxID=180675 RepID=UPI001C274F9F|nr:meiotically up-regulated gene 184 protein-like [Salvia splendens]